MKNAFFSVLLVMSAPSFATEILPEHSGRFRCQCLHEGCKGNSPADVNLNVDHMGNRLTINYGDEIQSGAPARTVHSDGSVTYTLASRGNVSFSAKAEMKFGWGKLWTCQRLP